MATEEQPGIIAPTEEEGFTRDSDLEQIFLHADKVSPAGVQQLVDALQKYRTMVRQAIGEVDYAATDSHRTTSVYRLKDYITAMNGRLSELQWMLDLDHIALEELGE